MSEYASSDEGQFLFELLAYLGMGLPQWLELDPREAHFLATAFSVKNRREAEQHRRAEQKARAKQMVRR